MRMVLPEYEDYATLWENSNEDDRLLAFLDRVAATFVPEHLKSNEARPRRLRILDIGAGDGRKTLSFLKSVEFTGVSVELDIVEPEETCLRRFEAQVAAQYVESRISAVWPFKWHEVVHKLPRSQYDIVLSSHSIYEYIGYPSGDGHQTQIGIVNELISATLQTVVSGGRLCIILGNESNAISLLRGRFLPTLCGQDELHATQLCRGLKGLRLPTLSGEISGQWLDVTQFSETLGEHKRDGWQRFLRFLFHVNPEDVSERCEEAVRSDLFALSERLEPYRVADLEALTRRKSGNPNELLAVRINDTCLMVDKIK